MEIISFVVGCILIGVAVIGGGFEAREIKIPRVGPGVRVVSMFVGLGFIVLALALFGIGLERARADAGAPEGSSALAAGPVTDTSATPAVDGTEQSPTPAEPVVASRAAADPLAAFAPADTEAAFEGFQGNNVLTWVVGQTTVTGVVQANLATGLVTISWQDAQGTDQRVDEDLELRQEGERFYYVGSTPRYSGTDTPYPGYEPDYFVIDHDSDGGWTYLQACDRVTKCHAIDDIRAGD